MQKFTNMYICLQETYRLYSFDATEYTKHTEGFQIC